MEATCDWPAVISLPPPPKEDLQRDDIRAQESLETDHVVHGQGTMACRSSQSSVSRQLAVFGFQNSHFTTHCCTESLANLWYFQCPNPRAFSSILTRLWSLGGLKLLCKYPNWPGYPCYQSWPVEAGSTWYLLPCLPVIWSSPSKQKYLPPPPRPADHTILQDPDITFISSGWTIHRMDH